MDSWGIGLSERSLSISLSQLFQQTMRRRYWNRLRSWQPTELRLRDNRTYSLQTIDWFRWSIATPALKHEFYQPPQGFYLYHSLNNMGPKEYFQQNDVELLISTRNNLFLFSCHSCRAQLLIISTQGQANLLTHSK